MKDGLEKLQVRQEHFASIHFPLQARQVNRLLPTSIGGLGLQEKAPAVSDAFAPQKPPPIQSSCVKISEHLCPVRAASRQSPDFNVFRG